MDIVTSCLYGLSPVCEARDSGPKFRLDMQVIHIGTSKYHERSVTITSPRSEVTACDGCGEPWRPSRTGSEALEQASDTTCSPKHYSRHSIIISQHYYPCLLPYFPNLLRSLCIMWHMMPRLTDHETVTICRLQQSWRTPNSRSQYCMVQGS